MKRLEPFFNWASSGLPASFVQQLDRMFGLALSEYEPSSATITGFTFSPTDKIDSLQVNATSGNLTVYLPSQPNGNRRRRVIKTDVSVNTVTVSGNGSLINGSATFVLNAQYDKVWVEPTGTGWLIIG